MSFYDEWLNFWDRAEEERRVARKSIHEEELEWVETLQDERAALMIAPETGFRTWGTVTMIAEIAPGAATGAHKHGEESILIIEGTGFSVVDNVRYDWMKHSLISIPYGSVHQHFNTGDSTVRYLSVLSPHLEYYCGLHRMIQLEPWGRIGMLPDVERSPDGKAPEGNRICLHRTDALVKSGETDGAAVALASMPEFDPEHPLVVGDLDGMISLPTGFHKSQVLAYQRIGKDMNDFVMNEVEISGLLTDPPNEYGGMHAHMEAHLYILQGEGYSTVGDDKVSWKTGTAFQVPGPQTPHRHVNESDVPSEMVRIAFGIRYFFERAAKREFPYLYLSPRQAMMERNSSSS